MIKVYLSSISKSRSLTAQIKNAEQQISIRQREAGVRADTLTRKIHQQITAPSTLLLAGGIGFIIGELTKRQTSKNRGAAGKQRTTGTSPLRTALNLMTTVHTLYTALPIAWKIKFFHQYGSSSQQASDLQSEPESAASGAAGKPRRSSR